MATACCFRWWITASCHPTVTTHSSSWWVRCVLTHILDPCHVCARLVRIPWHDWLWGWLAVAHTLQDCVGSCDWWGQRAATPPLSHYSCGHTLPPCQRRSVPALPRTTKTQHTEYTDYSPTQHTVWTPGNTATSRIDTRINYADHSRHQNTLSLILFQLNLISLF